MRLTPEQYFNFRNKGYSDEDLAEELTKREGIDIDALYRQGKTPGEIAREYSGIDETDYENTIHPEENRGVFGTVLSGLARGTGDVAHMAGNVLKTLDPEGGSNIGDAAGQALLDVEDYAKSKLDIMRPDRDEVEGKDSFLKRGIKGALRSAPAAIGVMAGATALTAATAPVLAAAATVAPVLGAPAIATGLSSLIAGSLGGAAYGLNTYADALKEYKVQHPEASEVDAYNYAKTRGLKEGGAEFVSNAITMGLFKFGRISNIAPAETIKQILKTPPKQLAKLWGLEVGQELATEEYQSISEVRDKQAAGMPTPSVTEAAIETVLPTVLLSSIFWLGGTGMEAKTRYNTLAALNSPDKETRLKAADSITNVLNSEDQPLIAKAWDAMAKHKINAGDHLDIDANIVAFDPDAKTTAKAQETTPIVEPDGTELPLPGSDAVVPNNIKLEDGELPVPEPAVLSKMLDTDIRPYKKDRPYTSELFATKALENMAAKKLDRENFDYPVVAVDGGFVIRPAPKKVATETVVETKAGTIAPDGVTLTDVAAKAVPTVKKTVTQTAPLSAEQIASATNITVGEYTKLKPETQAQLAREAAVVLGTNVRTVQVEKDVPVETAEVKALSETGDLTKTSGPKVTTIPSTRNAESTNEWAPANLTADVLHEKQSLRPVQNLALGQLREATLPENDFKPWPVSTVTDAKGQRDAAGFNWINKKAIAALPIEQQPKGPVTISTLKALEKKGFIKKAIYTDGITRWVPTEWKAPVKKEATLVKATQPVVPPVPSTQLPTPDNTNVQVKSKLDSDIDTLGAQLKQAKEIGAQPEVIAELKQALGKLTMKKLKSLAVTKNKTKSKENVSIEAQKPEALSNVLESPEQALNEPKTSLKETKKNEIGSKKQSDAELADAAAMKTEKKLSHKQKVRKKVQKDLDAFFGKNIRNVSEVVDSYEDLPEDVRKSHEDYNNEDPLFAKATRKDMLGLHDPGTNKMYFLANNLNEAIDSTGNVQAVGIHEGVHYLLRNSPEFKLLYKSLLARMERNKISDPKVQEAIDFAKEQTPDSKNHTEEGLAYYLQDSRNANRPLYKEIISKIRIWFDKHFVGLKLTGHEMGMIVADALRTQSTKAQAPSTTAPATDKITVSRVKNGKKVSTTVSTEEATQEVKDNQTTIQRLTQMLDCL